MARKRLNADNRRTFRRILVGFTRAQWRVVRPILRGCNTSLSQAAAELLTRVCRHLCRRRELEEKP